MTWDECYALIRGEVAPTLQDAAIGITTAFYGPFPARGQAQEPRTDGGKA